MSDDIVENQIIASRMALTVMEHTGNAFDTLRQFTQHLEGQELDSRDILRPDTVCLLLVDQWVEAGMERGDLQTAIDPLQRQVGELILRQYQAVNAFCTEQGVTPDNDLRSRCAARRRVVIACGTGLAGLAAIGPILRPGVCPGEHARHACTRAHGGPGNGLRRGHAGLHDAAGPARQRAQGVMGQLRRLLVQPATGFDMVNAPPASAALAQALSAHRAQAQTYYSGVATLVEDYSPAAVVQLVGAVRERSTELKAKASTPGEKAIIEVVALMFQSILSEDRIPRPCACGSPGCRCRCCVWRWPSRNSSATSPTPRAA